MKRNLFLFFTLVLSLAFGGTAQAVPMYYTFEGTAGTIVDDAGIAAGISAGAPVSYVFVVDRDAARTTTHGDGSVDTVASTSQTTHLVDGQWVPWYNFANFYADYHSGGLLDAVGGGLSGAIAPSSYVTEWNNGYDRTAVDDPTDKIGILLGGSTSDSVQIQSGSLYVSEWVVGSQVQGIEQAYAAPVGDTQPHAYFYSTLRLTSISETAPTGAAPVPEPGTMLLLGSGLVGLIGARRNFGK